MIASTSYIYAMNLLSEKSWAVFVPHFLSQTFKKIVNQVKIVQKGNIHDCRIVLLVFLLVQLPVNVRKGKIRNP